MGKRKSTYQKCGARTKDGTPCKRPAGWGTDTPGKGPCRNHLHLATGGPSGGPDIAFYVHDDLVKLAKRHRKSADSDPFDLTDDIAACRATRDELLRRADATQTAILQWMMDTGNKPPKSIDDLAGYSTAQKIFTTIGKLVETQLKREAYDSLTKADVQDLFSRIGDTPPLVLREVLADLMPDLDPVLGGEIVGRFSRKIAETWQALAARA